MALKAEVPTNACSIAACSRHRGLGLPRHPAPSAAVTLSYREGLARAHMRDRVYGQTATSRVSVLPLLRR